MLRNNALFLEKATEEYSHGCVPTCLGGTQARNQKLITGGGPKIFRFLPKLLQGFSSVSYSLS